VQNLTAQKVCLALITLGFFIAAPWVTSESVGGNFTPLFFLAGIGSALIFLFVLGDRCWMAIPLCLSMEGSLNFLPINFSMPELAVILVLIYILIQIVLGRQIKWTLGPAFIWAPLSGLILVLLYHWVNSGGGIRLFGAATWGGRKYFSIFVAALTLPVIASFSGSSWQDFAKVPFLYFLGTFVDLIPNTLTTVLPATAPLVYRIYSAVNYAGYGASLGGNFGGEVGITRFYSFARLGLAFGLLLLCYVPLRVWLSPARLWVAPSLLLGFLSCAASGFRSFVFNYFLAVSAALFAAGRLKSFLFLPLILAGALAVAFSHGVLVEYPLGIQRALSFLPGKWDSQAKEESESSSKWRQRIRELFFAEYFQRAPWFGTGYNFNPDYAKRSADLYMRAAAAAIADPFEDARGFIEMKQPHEGDVHALLISGIVGAAFFVTFCVCLISFSFRSILQTPISQLSPVQIWALALIVQQCLSFFIVFGDLSMTLPQLCPIAAILAASQNLRPKVIHLPHAPIPFSSGNPS
jgi:hypothetical protein